MEASSSPSALLNRGIAAYRNGNRSEARDLIVRSLSADPNNEHAWLWFATVATDRGEQRYAINRALTVNPESVGRARLERLERTAPVVPPELANLEPPPLPPDLHAVQTGSSGRSPIVPLRRRDGRPTSDAAKALTEPGSAGDGAAAEIADGEAGVDAADGDESVDGGKRSGWRLWLAAAVAIVLIAGAVVWVARDSNRQLYRVAIVAPRTGALAKIGEEQVRAAQMGVDEINAAGGVAGRNLELVAYDDQNDADIA